MPRFHPFPRQPLRPTWPGWMALAVSGALSACSLPPPSGLPTSQSPAPHTTADTALGQAIAQLTAQAAPAPGDSGIYPLPDAQEAFAARAVLARTAQRTLDVQYYIWRDDKTGWLLLHELLMAADRGVRVRLLLDDGGTNGLDEALNALHQHPQIEVRLFNPFLWRDWRKPLGYVTQFPRSNRRMHNKSFTADSQASIVGGRNVGNEYFGATDGVLFADLDVLAVGPIVPDIAQDFDRYWASASVHTIDAVAPHAMGLSTDALRARGQALQASPAAQDYRQSIAATPLAQTLLQAQLPLQWSPARLVSDDPAKGVGQAHEAELIAPQLEEALGQPLQRLDLVSPYFVPTAQGVAALTALQQRGVQVRILTNALEATDVAVVHAGYMPYRRPLLEAGVEIYEMRRQAPDYADDDERVRLQLAPQGSSGSSLHAKTFAVDGERVFIGSFNFDPRSINLNTEMGVVLHNPRMAQAVHDTFRTATPERAYRLSLGADGQLQWHSGVGDPPPVYTTEPQTRWYQRWVLKVMGWLPIEWLL